MEEKNTERKFNLKKMMTLNKYTITLLVVLSMFTIGTTYAYFAYQEEDTVAIKGNVIAINVELDVDLVVGTNTKMVPLQNDALSNALNGEGSDNGACIDNKSNLSCQVYKITLNNKGSRLKNINGTIELYAKEGSGNAYTNLKWRELTNLTTIKENSIINGMDEAILVTDLTLESKDVKTWYIAVWISETNSDQLETDKGIFEGTVTFENGRPQTNVFTETILAPNAKPDANIDFTENSEQSKTNGIYLRSETTNDLNRIYYYRGNVDNNLIFANLCWKVVRTTETGGLKLIYNGTPTDGKCNNTGEATQISTMSFNENGNSPAHSGYMYSTPYEIGVLDDIEMIYNSYFGNDVTYSNGMYTLIDAKTTTQIMTTDTEMFANNHYVCLNNTTTCSSVAYIYMIMDGAIFYLTLTDGKNIEQALDSMLGVDDSNSENYNTISSTIKGNNTTEGTLDYWYYTNIQQKGYNNYLEDTIWCNDRSIYSIGGFNPNGGIVYDEEGGGVNSALIFSSYIRFNMGNPSLICSRNIDKFTVTRVNGNGNLDYPVGLLTSDEIMLAGLGNSSFTNYSSFYLGSGADYSLNGAMVILGNIILTLAIDSNGNAAESTPNVVLGVRPSISLKPGFSLTGNGDGSVDKPYIVE